MSSKPEAFTLPSFAKVNLFLRIIGKRNDGFHELFTVFQTVSLNDTLEFQANDSLEVVCSDPAVPTGEANLVMRAANELRILSGITCGARIELTKRIPSPGGLGGGSSNAAVTLIGLNKLWDIGATVDDLHRIAAKLGSDVPFFLYGGTAIGTGRGEAIEPIEDILCDNLLLVTPNISISTNAAFAAIRTNALTIEAQDHILWDCRLRAESIDLRSSALTNDFEASVFAAYPEIARVKSTLLGIRAVNAALSGSGASVFAVFDKQETRQAALKSLDREPTWRKFAVSTVSRDEYREALRC